MRLPMFEEIGGVEEKKRQKKETRERLLPPEGILIPNC